MITKQGVITSAKMKDTVTVTVHRAVRHSLYRKSFRVSKKFLADTAGMTDIAIGDEVIIGECRPLSKRKHFKLLEVVKRAPRVSEMSEGKGVDAALNRAKEEDSTSSDSSDK